MRWSDPHGPGLSRTGGAGPSDHKAVRLGDQVLMVPIFNAAAAASPFEAVVDSSGRATLYRDGQLLSDLSFPRQPRFYSHSTSDGVPFWKIATLHGEDVLATTVLQNCIRYADPTTSCQFCAIGRSLAARSTIARKSPRQLAEVAQKAVELDGVAHMVMTTGTPPGEDRGAKILCDSAEAVKSVVPLPIQAQCEPPEDAAWYGRLKAAGVDSLGMHLEAVNPMVRRRIMPGKAEVEVHTYLRGFEAAVSVFGPGQVSTYILAGLGDTEDEIVDACTQVTALGVYPFVVPFVPISGTPLSELAPPQPEAMVRLLDRVASVIEAAGLSSQSIKAGCGRCGACSTLRSRESVRPEQRVTSTNLEVAHV
jgi:radical SAM protein (TIGR04043 family)